MGIHSNYLKGDYSLWWSTCYKFSSNVIHEMEVIWLTIILASLKLSEGKLSIFQAKALKQRSYPTFLSYTGYTWNKMKYTWCVNDYWIAPPYPDELISTAKSQQRGRKVNKLDEKELQYLWMGWSQRGRRQGAKDAIQSCLCFCETWEECENWAASNTIASFCFGSAEKSHSMISSE